MSQGRPVTDSSRVAGLRLAEGATNPGMQAASGSGSGLAGNGSSASIPRGALPARTGGSARVPHNREVRVLWFKQLHPWSFAVAATGNQVVHYHPVVPSLGRLFPSGLLLPS